MRASLDTMSECNVLFNKPARRTMMHLADLLLVRLLYSRGFTHQHRPTGFWDPLKLSEGISEEQFNRFRTVEQKHGILSPFVLDQQSALSQVVSL